MNIIRRKILLALTALFPVSAMACPNDAYLGTICYTPYEFCPRDYLPADGRPLSIAQYTALFAVMGTIYGSDDQTNFKLPDLRSRVAIGVGTGPGMAPVTPGQMKGMEEGWLTEDVVPPHSHTVKLDVHGAHFEGTNGNTGLTVEASVPVSDTDATGNIDFSTTDEIHLAKVKPNLYTNTFPGGNTHLPVVVNITGSINQGKVTGSTIAIQKEQQPVSLSQPSLGLRACINVDGVFPPRY